MNPNQVLERGSGVVFGAVRLVAGLAGRIGSQAYRIVDGARGGGETPKPEMDDVTLARKVETEIFRGRPGMKSAVDVNVADGVVWLRGEVRRPTQVRELAARAEAVPEVRRVENLLHLVKTPAPTRADTPPRAQRTRSSTRRPTPDTERHGRVSDDRTDAIVDAEPSPTEHAAAHEGRTPAPFGSTGSGTDPGAGHEPSTHEPSTP